MLTQSLSKLNPFEDRIRHNAGIAVAIGRTSAFQHSRSRSAGVRRESGRTGPRPARPPPRYDVPDVREDACSVSSATKRCDACERRSTFDFDDPVRHGFRGFHHHLVTVRCELTWIRQIPVAVLLKLLLSRGECLCASVLLIPSPRLGGEFRPVGQHSLDGFVIRVRFSLLSDEVFCEPKNFRAHSKHVISDFRFT